MVEFDEQLRHLVEQACGYKPGSPQRQKLLTQIIRLTANRLWRENTPYYQDALQQTWLYLCRNLCEGLTGRVFNPEFGSVVTWLNAYLKHRLHDFRLKETEERKTIAPEIRNVDKDEALNPIDSVPAPPQTPPILENLELWIKEDTTGELRQTHVKGRPEVNCQVLLLKRLPPEVSWKELSQEFNLPIPTLSSFYQRQCLPRLRKFAEIEGYL